MKTVWALFDSGDGSYSRALKDNYNVIAIGKDKLNENKANFMNLDLANNSLLFDDTSLFDELDKLPHPDIILASPPCESWSNASAMMRGNTCWYSSETEFKDGHVEKSKFTVRTSKHIDSKNHTPFKVDFAKTVRNRINGELCAFNTMEIIKHYKPEHYIIENPMTSKIFDYYEDVCDWHNIRNKVRYNNYDSEYPQKPTIFFSDIDLELDSSVHQSDITIGVDKRKGARRKQIRNYNVRSSIPTSLIVHAINKIESYDEVI